MFVITLKDGKSLEASALRRNGHGIDALCNGEWMWVGSSNIKSIKYIP